jgi:hypothetical protein
MTGKRYLDEDILKLLRGVFRVLEMLKRV